MILLRNGSGGPCLLQPVDEHDATGLEREFAHIRQLADDAPFLLAALPVEDWGTQLSPWAAPPVFGNSPFGGGGARYLAAVEEEILPRLRREQGVERFLLGGYSLAGLFALWAACESGAFAGAAGVSPSVWFPGWTAYLTAHPPRVPAVYLSLGDREARARSPVMATVADRLTDTEELLRAQGVFCCLEWNPGNHFQESELRTAKGFAWLLRAAEKERL